MSGPPAQMARRLAFVVCLGSAALARVAAFSLREVAPHASAVLIDVSNYALYAAIPASILGWIVAALVSAARGRRGPPGDVRAE